MAEAFAPAVTDALLDPSPRESMHRVKSVVAAELEILDRTARVRTTDYFNHTFAPDMIMSWRDQPEREVFLRLERDPHELVESMEFIRRAGPMVLALGPEREAGHAAEPTDELPERAMISSPQALDVLIGRREQDATGGMLANAVAQGGRGVIFSPEASVLAQSLAGGLAAAQGALVEPTRQAVSLLSETLAEPQAARLTRVLQAVWEGGAGRLDEFPGPKELLGRLGTDALQYLIEWVADGELEFWRTVGRKVTVADLLELDPSGHPENFDALVRANLDVIEARACAVIDNPQRELQGNLDADYWWTIRERRLTLECPGFFAVLGESKPDIEPLAKGPRIGLDVGIFASRARGWYLHEVSIQSGGESVTHSSDDGPLDQTRLISLASQLGPRVDVRRAVVDSASGRVTVDFPSASGTGVTRSRVRAADLLRSTLPLVRDVSASEATEFWKALWYPVPDMATGTEPFDLDNL